MINRFNMHTLRTIFQRLVLSVRLGIRRSNDNYLTKINSQRLVPNEASREPDKLNSLRVGVPLIILVLFLAGCEDIDPAAGRARLHLPPDGYIPDAKSGLSAFRKNCAKCHGVDAFGTQQGPPLVHKTYEPSHHPDMAFHLAVKNGVKQHHWNYGNMPPQPQVSPEATADIALYIRTKQKEYGID